MDYKEFNIECALPQVPPTDNNELFEIGDQDIAEMEDVLSSLQRLSIEPEEVVQPRPQTRSMSRGLAWNKTLNQGPVVVPK